MGAGSGLENGSSVAAGSFTATHWTVVLAASQPGEPQAHAALETLCKTYWRPLYGFVRRRGYSPHDAQDLTQAFFEQILEKGRLRAVDRNRGKFRSFLLAALENFLANEWRNAHTQKRGGHHAFISLDEITAEHWYLGSASDTLSPGLLYERQWALTLLERVVTRLQQEFVAAGKARAFDTLKVFLTGEKAEVSYAELAETLATTEAALKMSVSRMRRRYGELLREEISHTVSTPAELEDEMRALLNALSL